MIFNIFESPFFKTNKHHVISLLLIYHRFFDDELLFRRFGVALLFLRFEPELLFLLLDLVLLLRRAPFPLLLFRRGLIASSGPAVRLCLFVLLLPLRLKYQAFIGLIFDQVLFTNFTYF